MKKIFLAVFLLTPVVTLLVGLPVPAYSQFSWPPICQEGSLPSHDPKFAANQLIVVCIPPDWNQQLVIYAHGYVAPQAPLQLPIDELTLPDGMFVPNVFLSQGFAFATTSFRKNGAAVEQAAEDINHLLQHFKNVVGPRLQKVFITGASEGGLIALLLLERFPGKYDAGLALCAPLGGSTDLLKYTYDFRVVFDYFFPAVFTFPPNQPGEQRFGATDVPENAFLFWDTVYVPRIVAALATDPLATVQLYQVTQATIDAADPTSVITTALSLLFYSIFGANDQIITSGGVPYDNRSTAYLGSANDGALNAEVERIESDGRAGAYALRFYQPKGTLHGPLVALHNTLDPIVPFSHLESYGNLVAQKRKDAFLSILPSPGYGHCNFTNQELFQAFALMVQ